MTDLPRGPPYIRKGGAYFGGSPQLSIRCIAFIPLLGTAAQCGRISRDPDGKMDPERADREWYENTRPRVDIRCPVVPEMQPKRLAADVARRNWRSGMGRTPPQVPPRTVANAPGTVLESTHSMAENSAVKRTARRSRPLSSQRCLPAVAFDRF